MSKRIGNPKTHATGWLHERTRPVRKINRQLMKDFDKRAEQPENCHVAIRKCMLLIVQLRSHDPLVIQAATGYALEFIVATIRFLLKRKCWTGWGGYAGLICALGDLPDTVPVLEECNDIFSQMRNSSYYAAVERAWCRNEQSAILNPFTRVL